MIGPCLFDLVDFLIEILFVDKGRLLCSFRAVYSERDAWSRHINYHLRNRLFRLSLMMEVHPLIEHLGCIVVVIVFLTCFLCG